MRACFALLFVTVAWLPSCGGIVEPASPGTSADLDAAVSHPGPDAQLPKADANLGPESSVPIPDAASKQDGQSLDPQCASKPDVASCQECCRAAYEMVAIQWDQQWRACVCAAPECAGVCPGSPVCAGIAELPAPPCLQCAEQALSPVGSCYYVVEKCEADPQCKPFHECILSCIHPY